MSKSESVAHYAYLWSAPYREEGEEEIRKIVLGPRCQKKAQTIMRPSPQHGGYWGVEKGQQVHPQVKYNPTTSHLVCHLTFKPSGQLPHNLAHSA